MVSDKHLGYLGSYFTIKTNVKNRRRFDCSTVIIKLKDKILNMRLYNQL